jgi:hypothetical protein
MEQAASGSGQEPSDCEYRPEKSDSSIKRNFSDTEETIQDLKKIVGS